MAMTEACSSLENYLGEVHAGAREHLELGDALECCEDEVCLTALSARECTKGGRRSYSANASGITTLAAIAGAAMAAASAAVRRKPKASHVHGSSRWASLAEITKAGLLREADRPPSSLYVPSSRALPRRLEPPHYPDAFQTRKVAASGRIRWNGELVTINHALEGEWIGIERRDAKRAFTLREMTVHVAGTADHDGAEWAITMSETRTTASRARPSRFAVARIWP